MNPLRFACLLFTLTCAVPAFAQDADSRTAKVTDRADVESQVSGVTVSNVDLRFGFLPMDNNGRVVVTTQTIIYAVPIRAISSVVQAGSSNWKVKLMTKDGEASVEGSLPEAGLLLGNSDFGSFSLPLVRLRKLDFAQPGVEAKPARRPNIYDRSGRARPATFNATITLTDGTQLAVEQLRRNEAYAESMDDPLVVTPTPEYTVVSTNYTDLSLVRGETTQIVPFENINTAQFLPGDAVLIKTRGGAEAEMKLPRRDERSLEGFTGFCGKGDFYVPLRYLKSISFVTEPK